MATHLGQIDWSEYSESIPAFLTVVMMPFTYSIANGISFGIISLVMLKLTTGRWRQIHPVMAVLCVILAARYVWLSE